MRKEIIQSVKILLASELLDLDKGFLQSILPVFIRWVMSVLRDRENGNVKNFNKLLSSHTNLFNF